MVNHEKNRYQRSYYRKNKLKLKAQTLARRAVRDGVVEEAPCFKCGTTEERLYVYHDDYEKPMDFKFICGTCKLEDKHNDLEELYKIEKRLAEQGRW